MNHKDLIDVLYTLGIPVGIVLVCLIAYVCMDYIMARRGKRLAEAELEQTKKRVSELETQLKQVSRVFIYIPDAQLSEYDRDKLNEALMSACVTGSQAKVTAIVDGLAKDGKKGRLSLPKDFSHPNVVQMCDTHIIVPSIR